LCGSIEIGQGKNYEGGIPRRFKNLSYQVFKQSYNEGENKTIIHQGDSLLFWNPDEELFHRYNFEFWGLIGYPFVEYSWFNPVIKETTTYGWVLVIHEPFTNRVIQPHPPHHRHHPPLLGFSP